LPAQKNSKRKLLHGQGNIAIHRPRVATITRDANNTPPKYKPVSLLKYNGYGHSRKFIMSYEATVNSAGGDDLALVKSFIIVCEDLILNWYSLLPPLSIYN
jgi:hypothetical protein